jgi:hypothetical protein
MIINEIKSVKSGRKELRSFAITIGIAAILLGSLFFWRGKAYYPFWLIIGSTVLLLGFVSPRILVPFHKVWMTISILMGWIMTRIILIVLFYVILTPIGLVARLMGKDFLNLKIDTNFKSYWIPRSSGKQDKISYERQF